MCNETGQNLLQIVPPPTYLCGCAHQLCVSIVGVLISSGGKVHSQAKNIFFSPALQIISLYTFFVHPITPQTLVSNPLNQNPKH